MEENNIQNFMNEAIDESNYNKPNNFNNGGPFGAVIVKDGKIISKAHNTVLESKDPTAHAEVNAIRMASKYLNTHDLYGCTIFASSEPCPMCLSAIIWSNIKVAYYSNTKEHAGEIGFRDDMIYDFLKGKNNLLEEHHIESDIAYQIFEDYKNNPNTIIY